MSNELSATNYNLDLGLSLTDFNKIASSTKFLPYIQLHQPSSKQVTQRKAQSGNFGLSVGKDEFKSLGDSFDFFPLQVRAKAIDLTTKVTSFDMNSAVFAEIANRSKIKNSQCLAGPEFLIWLPGEAKFATIFFGNTTMRNRAGDLLPMVGKKAVTIKSKFIPSQEYGGWFGPEITPCSTPFELPSVEEVIEHNNTFMNPTPGEEVELAEESNSREH